MALERLLYVSSLVDEYGFALAPLLTALGRSNPQDEISSISLFGNGNLMQMLEGPAEQLRTAFANLRAEPFHFEHTVMIQQSTVIRTIQGTQLGLNRFVEEVGKSLPACVGLFVLSSEEVAARVDFSEALPLLLDFTAWNCV